MRSSPPNPRNHIRSGRYWPDKLRKNVPAREIPRPQSQADNRRQRARMRPTEGLTKVKFVEPPSCSSPSTVVLIGKNHRGQWVAQEQNGLYGGLFVSRAQAIKYALFENGQHLETIVELPREIELDMSKRPQAAANQRAA